LSKKTEDIEPPVITEKAVVQNMPKVFCCISSGVGFAIGCVALNVMMEDGQIKYNYIIESLDYEKIVIENPEDLKHWIEDKLFDVTVADTGVKMVVISKRSKNHKVLVNVLANKDFDVYLLPDRYETNIFASHETFVSALKDDPVAGMYIEKQASDEFYVPDMVRECVNKAANFLKLTQIPNWKDLSTGVPFLYATTDRRLLQGRQ
jgi:hypothetical protein